MAAARKTVAPSSTKKVSATKKPVLKNMDLAFEVDDEVTEETTNFVTSRPGPVRLSEPVRLRGLHYDENRKEIRAFGVDGKLRVCQVARLVGENEQARVLWKKLSTAGRSKQDVIFKAAGGFNPDRWFFDVELVD